MGSFFPQSEEAHFGPKQLAAVVPVACLIIFPLCLLRNLGALKAPSLVGIGGATFAFAYIIIDWLRFGCIESVAVAVPPSANASASFALVANQCFGAEAPAGVAPKRTVNLKSN